MTRIATAAGLTLLFVGVVGTACDKPPAPPTRGTAVPVTSTIVTAQTVPMSHTYPGITASPRSIEIDARVEGFLLKQGIADGAVTKVNDVIYRIDPRPFEAALAGAEGSLVQALAQRDYAKKEMDRNAPLVPVSAISQESFDKLVANYEIAKGQAITAQANVDTAKLNLSYCTMQAPFVGLLGASQFFEGAVVGNAQSQRLNTLVQIDPMWVQFSPSETEWPMFAGLLAKGDLTANIVYGGDEKISATGKIVFTNNQVSSETGSMMMRVEFTNPNLIFRPGIYCDVRVVLGDQPNIIVVPQESVFARETDLYVWRIKADDTVESVLVKPLRKFGSSIALTSGPSVGDRIAVEGIQRLKPGAKVVEAAAAKSPTP